MQIKQDLTKFNFTKGRSGYHIEGIVIHSMVGTQAGSISWFKNPDSDASAHYCISKSGEVVQCVLDEDFAWHAGNVSAKYENMPFVLKDNWDAGVKNPNFYTIGIELEDLGDVHWNYPDKQMEALRDLIKFLSGKYNIPLKRSHIIMHKEVDPARKSDPIGNFSIDKLMIMLGDQKIEDCTEWKKKAEYEEGEKEKYKSEARAGRITIETRQEELEESANKYADLLATYKRLLEDSQNPTTPPEFTKEDYDKLVKANNDLDKEITRITGELTTSNKNLETAKTVANNLSLEVTRLMDQKFTIGESLYFLWEAIRGVKS